jgi:hypothetical protein
VVPIFYEFLCAFVTLCLDLFRYSPNAFANVAKSTRSTRQSSLRSQWKPVSAGQLEVGGGGLYLRVYGLGEPEQHAAGGGADHKGTPDFSAAACESEIPPHHASFRNPSASNYWSTFNPSVASGLTDSQE